MKKYSGFLSGLDREIAQLNDHMPRTKKVLADMLAEPAPGFTSREGQKSAVRVAELKELAAIIPNEYHKQVMLPFTILRRTSLGPGAHTIGGSKFEQFIVLHILGKINNPFETWRSARLPRIIYSPEVGILRQKFPTLVTIGFGK
ncbi:MAG: DUF61 family protein [Candidatus Hermodarchaeia archaeon]|jgi:uncharacterized protein (UPF0216 family)